MPIPCKIEIFDRSFGFRGFAVIQDPDIAYDYLTLEPTSVVCKSISAQKGDLAVITQGAHALYHGIVDDVQISTETTLSLKPMLSLFDCDVVFDRSQSHTLETFLAGIITANFVANSDTLQNIAGMTVTTTSTTTGYLNLKDNIHNLAEIISKCLTAYGVTVEITFDPQAQTVPVVIGRQTNAVTIEADLRGIIDRQITLGDSYGAANKIVVVNEDDETETETYYLHTDGTIDTDGSTSRITPVFPTAAYAAADGGTFSQAAYAAAYDAIKPDAYDNLIELTIPTNSRIADAYMPIGTAASVINGGNAYASILTGFRRSGETTTLVFGCVRADLTKKLILERRRSR